MTHYRTRTAVLTVGAVLALGGSVAISDDCGLKVDFEDFDPDLRYCGNDFELKVEYEIEFDNSSPDDRFTLILRPSECGRPMVDADGQPITFSVPLDCPKKWKGKDRDYEATARFNLPANVVNCPDDVRVQGTVINERDNAPLACKDKHADLHGGHYAEYAVPVAVAAPVYVEPAPVFVPAPPPVVYVEPCPPPVVVARPRTIVVSGHYGRHYAHRPIHRRAVVVNRGW